MLFSLIDKCCQLMESRDERLGKTHKRVAEDDETTSEEDEDVVDQEANDNATDDDKVGGVEAEK